MIMAEEENKSGIKKEKKISVKKEKTADEKAKEARVAEKGNGKKQNAPRITAKVDDPFRVIKFVLMTEKAVQVIEKQNKLVFIVEKKADKNGIKASVETAFNSPVTAVQTLIDQDGKKRAFVKFRNAGAAGDIAIRLGII